MPLEVAQKLPCESTAPLMSPYTWGRIGGSTLSSITPVSPSTSTTSTPLSVTPVVQIFASS